MKNTHPALVHLLVSFLVACSATPFRLRAAVPTVEAPMEAWAKRQGSYLNAGLPQFESIKVATDERGDVIVTGVIVALYDGVGSDILTIKYSGVDGSVIWSRRYGGEVNSTDWVRGLAIDSDGNALVIGVTDARGNWDFYTAKYASANGALLWERRYNGPANQDDGATAVTTDASGNVFVAGMSQSTNGWDYCMVKYAASDGALLWKRCYESQTEFDVAPREIATDSQGNVVVTGAEKTIKYAAADGTVLWQTFGAHYLVVDALNDVFVAGFSIEMGTSRVAKLAAPDGFLLWDESAPGSPGGLVLDAHGDLIVMGGNVTKYAGADGSLVWTHPDSGNAMAVDCLGNVILATTIPCAGDATPRNCPMYSLVRLAAEDGHGVYLGSGLGDVKAVTVGKDGDVFVTGGSSAYFTAKHAGVDGALAWEQHLSGQAETTALAVDASENVVVTGHAFGVWHTARYAATNGGLIWEQHGPSGAARAVVLDATGDAAVMGTSNIIKYAATNGAVRWEQYFDGGGGNAHAMAMDSEGNVFVTGCAHGSFLESEFYTAKFATSDGALLWEVRYNSPAGLRGGGTAIAVDTSGNVVVTGHASVGSQNPGDHYTAKYAANDGRLMWEQRRSGVAARSLVLDANGDVISTGPSGTFKFAASNGALRWERPNAGPGNLNGEARALAVDSRGAIVVVGRIDWGELCTLGGQVAPRVALIGSYASKYAAEDGTLLWYHEDPPCWGTEGAEAVVIDNNDNVVVLGTQFGITKRSGRDGALLWETGYTGEDTIRNEHATNSRCLGLAPDGSVLITGGSDCAYERGSSFVESRTFATVKYVMTQVTYPTPVVLSLAFTAEGARLRFTGDAGRTYRLQRASNPAGPWWTTFATLAAPPDGAVEHLDPAPLSFPTFYRIAAP